MAAAAKDRNPAYDRSDIKGPDLEHNQEKNHRKAPEHGRHTQSKKHQTGKSKGNQIRTKEISATKHHTGNNRIRAQE